MKTMLFKTRTEHLENIINEICGHSVGDVWYRQSGNSVEMDSPDCFYVEGIWSIDPKYGNVL